MSKKIAAIISYAIIGAALAAGIFFCSVIFLVGAPGTLDLLSIAPISGAIIGTIIGAVVGAYRSNKGA
jgi:hypothetical protein